MEPVQSPVGVTAVRKPNNRDRKSTILSWFGVLLLGSVLSGLFGLVAASFAADWTEFSPWFQKWVVWNDSWSG